MSVKTHLTISFYCLNPIPPTYSFRIFQARKLSASFVSKLKENLLPADTTTSVREMMVIYIRWKYSTRLLAGCLHLAIVGGTFIWNFCTFCLEQHGLLLPYMYLSRNALGLFSLYLGWQIFLLSEGNQLKMNHHQFCPKDRSKYCSKEIKINKLKYWQIAPFCLNMAIPELTVTLAFYGTYSLCSVGIKSSWVFGCYLYCQLQGKGSNALFCYS